MMTTNRQRESFFRMPTPNNTDIQTPEICYEEDSNFDVFGSYTISVCSLPLILKYRRK